MKRFDILTSLLLVHLLFGYGLSLPSFKGPVSAVETVVDGRNVLGSGALDSEKLADDVAKHPTETADYVHIRNVDGSHESEGISAPETGKKSSLPVPQAPSSVDRNAVKDTTQEGKGSRVKAVQDYVSKVWKSFRKRILQAWRYLSDRVQSLKLRRNKVAEATEAEDSSKAASAASKSKVVEIDPAKTQIVKDQFIPSTSDKLDRANLVREATNEPLTTQSVAGHQSRVEVKNGEGTASIPADSQTKEVHQDSKKETNPPSSNVEDHPKEPLSDHKADVSPLKNGEKGVAEDAAAAQSKGVEFRIEPELTVDPKVSDKH